MCDEMVKVILNSKDIPENTIITKKTGETKYILKRKIKIGNHVIEAPDGKHMLIKSQKFNFDDIYFTDDNVSYIAYFRETDFAKIYSIDLEKKFSNSKLDLIAVLKGYHISEGAKVKINKSEYTLTKKITIGDCSISCNRTILLISETGNVRAYPDTDEFLVIFENDHEFLTAVLGEDYFNIY